MKPNREADIITTNNIGDIILITAKKYMFAK